MNIICFTFTFNISDSRDIEIMKSKQIQHEMYENTFTTK